MWKGRDFQSHALVFYCKLRNECTNGFDNSRKVYLCRRQINFD